MNNLGALLEVKGDIEGAENLMRRVLERREQTLGEDHPDTLSSLIYLAIVVNKLDRRSEAVEMLRMRYGFSEKVADRLRYILACFECLDGNLEEAKGLITEHLSLHPELKRQSLEDPALASIRDFIETL